MMEQSNFIEKWSRWELAPGLDPKYYLKDLVNDFDGLKLRLISDCDNTSGIDLLFKSAWAYRVSDESFRLGTMYQLKLKYGIDFHTEWTFFKVDNSEYLDWFFKESDGISAAYEMAHYCLMGLESIVDIAASEDPVVKLIKL